jgi:SAM-dependent methyltransferase
MGRACPVCGQAGARAVREMDYALFEGSTLPARTQIVQCTGCGMVYADSQASAADYVAHYRSASIYAAPQVRAGDGRTPQDRDRLGRVCDRLHGHLDATSVLVDIGAGTGGLLSQARERFGCRVVGVDPDPGCVSQLRDAGFEAFAGTLDDALGTQLSASADAVTLSHVLEHVWDPREALAIALRAARPGGVVYIETPDRDGYPDVPNVPWYYFDPEHINHFAQDDLARLAAACGAGLVAGGRSQIRLGDDSPYPVCWALVSSAVAPAAVSPLSSPGTAIERYVRQQEEASQRWQSTARERLGPAADWLIWGAGSQTQRVLAQAVIPLERVRGIVDSDPGKQGRRLAGFPVLSPAEGLARHEDAGVVILAARAAGAAIAAAVARDWPGRRVADLFPGGRDA